MLSGSEYGSVGEGRVVMTVDCEVGALFLFLTRSKAFKFHDLSISCNSAPSHEIVMTRMTQNAVRVAAISQ